MKLGHQVLIALCVFTVTLIATERPSAQRLVEAFLAAQDRRDLDSMCSMVAEDVTYINEPHEEARHIRSKTAFRKAFEGSPCIWAEEAKLEVECAPGISLIMNCM